MPKKIRKKRKASEIHEGRTRNTRNRQLRIDDQEASQDMRVIEQLDGLIRFDTLFRDNDACNRKILEYQGWKEVEDDSRKSGIMLKFQCEGKSKKKPCDSEEAIKIPRIDTYIPPQRNGEIPMFTTKQRFVYECTKCETQFNLYKDTIFFNRKGSDIWAWFLCLYSMYLLDGKMPRTWLKEKYINYLVEIEEVELPDDLGKKKQFERKIAERIRRITSKIANELFNENTETSEFLRYKALVFPETSTFCPNYRDRLNSPPKSRMKWKIAVRTEDYPMTSIEVKEYAKTEGVNSVYEVLYFNENMACEIGDWILLVKKVQESERGYYFRWLHVDNILKIKSRSSEFKWQAIQLRKIPAFHYRPFGLTNEFKDAFVNAIEAYRDEEGNELPLNEIMKCPESMLTTLAFEFC